MSRPRPPEDRPVIAPPDRDAGRVGAFGVGQRAIFRYRVGPPDWAGDPLGIEARFDDALGEANSDSIDLWLARDEVNTKLLAFRRLFPPIRAALALPALAPDGSGFTDQEVLAVFRRFGAWKARVAARYRRDAEMVATYGHFPGQECDYRRYVGLWLNRDRAQCLPGVAHWRGALAASGRVRAHFGLIDAMTPTLADAHKLEHAIEAARAEAAARGQRPAPSR